MPTKEKDSKNKSNLIPMSERSKDEVREIARKGGINSGVTRRRKKTLKEALDLLMSKDFKIQSEAADNIRNQLKTLGITEKDIDNQMAMAFSMFVNSVGTGRNAVASATFIRDTLGEKPKEVVEINNDLNDSIREIEDYLCNKKKS